MKNLIKEFNKEYKEGQLSKNKQWSYFLINKLEQQGIDCSTTTFIKNVDRSKFSDKELDSQYMYWLEDLMKNN